MTGLIECVGNDQPPTLMTEITPNLLYEIEFAMCSEAFPISLLFDAAQPGKIRVNLTDPDPSPFGCNQGFDSGWQTPTTPLPNLTYTTTPTFCRGCPCCSGFGIQQGWSITIEQI
jgi:hypothetical protein